MQDKDLFKKETNQNTPRRFFANKTLNIALSIASIIIIIAIIAANIYVKGK